MPAIRTPQAPACQFLSARPPMASLAGGLQGAAPAWPPAPGAPSMSPSGRTDVSGRHARPPSAGARVATVLVALGALVLVGVTATQALLGTGAPASSPHTTSGPPPEGASPSMNESST